MEKLIRNMSNSEFLKFKNKAERTPFSEFANFHLTLKGYDCYLNDDKIDKWEVFARGYKNADAILLGNSRITCMERVEEKPLY